MADTKSDAVMSLRSRTMGMCVVPDDLVSGEIRDDTTKGEP